MVKYFTVCAIFFVPLSALAQITAPGNVDLAYHFKEGTMLHYHRLEEMRNPDNPVGYVEGNWDIKEEVHIAIEKVDPDGSATLLVNNIETAYFKNGDNANGVTMGGLATDIPIYRVKIDKYGNYLDGSILQRSQQDSLFHEKMKYPNFIGETMPDSSRIKLDLEPFIYPRPATSKVQIGHVWTDTACQKTHNTIYHATQSASPAQEALPEKPSYKSHHYDYRITQELNDRQSDQYHLITNSMNYQLGMGRLLSQYTIEDNQKIRISDGLPCLRTQLSKRIGGMNVDNSYIKQTLMLISVDSTQ